MPKPVSSLDGKSLYEFKGQLQIADKEYVIVCQDEKGRTLCIESPEPLPQETVTFRMAKKGVLPGIGEFSLQPIPREVFLKLRQMELEK